MNWEYQQINYSFNKCKSDYDQDQFEKSIRKVPYRAGYHRINTCIYWCMVVSYDGYYAGMAG